MYSIIARILNRKATGFALFVGSIARNGGLREDSLKLLPQCVHPRTLQKYDHSLQAHSREPLHEQLMEEKTFIDNIKKIVEQMETLSIDDDSQVKLNELENELESLKQNTPKMLTTGWDNLNLGGTRRHERMTDNLEDMHRDCMTSLHIKERIDVNHLPNAGKAFKLPEELTLEDYIPSKPEKEFVFSSLIPLFSAALVKRHPTLFKSLNSVIKDHFPHQFQSQMSEKSEEYTGEIYEKSENRIEDLLSMIEDYQSEMVLSQQVSGSRKISFRRQLTGDQKTEKNSHYAILSKSDENTAEGSLAHIIPGHEYFHFLMCVADVESQLFRDCSRGLEGLSC